MGKKTAYDIEYAERLEIAKDEGTHFRARYDKDVRFVLARTNHHVHLPSKKGRMAFINKEKNIYIYIPVSNR